MSLSKKEISDILEKITKVYEEVGKKITTATLIIGDDAELLIDERKPESIN